MWIELTSDDLQMKLSAVEWSSIGGAQLPDGVTGAEIVADEIANTTNEVRGYVGGFRENTLGDGATIPDELKDTALVILRHKVFTRIPGLKRLLDDGRVREYDNAITRLKDVARGLFRIVQPATASEDQPSGQTMVVVRSTARKHSRETWGGTL